MSKEAPGFSVRRLVPILLIAVGAVLGLVFFGEYLSFETLAEQREALAAWRDQNYALAATVFSLLYILVVAFSLPGGLPMTLAGGFLFGPIMGGLLVVVAATIGATAIFLAAKTSFGDVLHGRMTQAGSNALLSRIEAGIRENAASYLLTLRLIPAVPFFLVNLAPAFFGVSLRTYVVTTFVGIIPGTFVYAWVGAGLGEVLDRGETPNLGIIFEPQILGPLIGLAALSLLPVVLKRFRKERVPG